MGAFKNIPLNGILACPNTALECRVSYKQSEGKFGNSFCHLLKHKNVSVFMMIHVLEEGKWKETPSSWESCGHSTAQDCLLLMGLSQSLHT